MRVFAARRLLSVLRMSTIGARGKFVVLSCTVAAWSLLAYACTVEEENPGRPPRTVEAGAGDGAISPTDTPPSANICSKYGGYANVKTIAAEIMSRVGQDCRINAYMALSPQATQRFNECFEIFVASSFGCPEVTYQANITTVSNNLRCRSMSQAHQNLNLRRADFEAFVQAINAGLEAKGVSLEDRQALAPSWEGTRNGVVQNNTQPTRNTRCACPNGLYNGQPCTVIVDAGTDANDAGTDANDGGDGG